MMEGVAVAIIVGACILSSWTFGAVIAYILVAKNAQKTTQHNTKNGETNADD
jgi:hypothetical protein